MSAKYRLDFKPLDPSDEGKVITAYNNRAWAFGSDNVWRLVDISVLEFHGRNPIVSTTNNSRITTEIDLNTIQVVPSTP